MNIKILNAFDFVVLFFKKLFSFVFNKKTFNDLFNIVFDPHTVTSLRMAVDINSSVPTVAIATASPEKFSNVISPLIEDFPGSDIDQGEDFQTLKPQKDQIIESIKAKFT